jgi:hypothetical protein
MKNTDSTKLLIAGIVLLLLLPPVGVGLLFYTGLVSRKTKPTVAWLAFGILTLIILALIFVFFIFDKSVHFA